MVMSVVVMLLANRIVHGRGLRGCRGFAHLEGLIHTMMRVSRLRRCVRGRLRRRARYRSNQRLNEQNNPRVTVSMPNLPVRYAVLYIHQLYIHTVPRIVECRTSPHLINATAQLSRPPSGSFLTCEVPSAVTLGNG